MFWLENGQVQHQDLSFARPFGIQKFEQKVKAKKQEMKALMRSSAWGPDYLKFRLPNPAGVSTGTVVDEVTWMPRPWNACLHVTAAAI